MSHPIRSSSISKKSPMPYRGMPATPPRRDTPARHLNGPAIPEPPSMWAPVRAGK